MDNKSILIGSGIAAGLWALISGKSSPAPTTLTPKQIADQAVLTAQQQVSSGIAQKSAAAAAAAAVVSAVNAAATQTVQKPPTGGTSPSVKPDHCILLRNDSDIQGPAVGIGVLPGQITKDTYDSLKQNGWTETTVPRTQDQSFFANAYAGLWLCPPGVSPGQLIQGK